MWMHLYIFLVSSLLGTLHTNDIKIIAFIIAFIIYHAFTQKAKGVINRTFYNWSWNQCNIILLIYNKTICLIRYNVPVITVNVLDQGNQLSTIGLCYKMNTTTVGKTDCTVYIIRNSKHTSTWHIIMWTVSDMITIDFCLYLHVTYTYVYRTWHTSYFHILGHHK